MTFVTVAWRFEIEIGVGIDEKYEVLREFPVLETSQMYNARIIYMVDFHPHTILLLYDWLYINLKDFVLILT